ncbi:hypothetical protein CRE_07882 [Caenorhabditis remanei]|uniref:DNA2/NAM7 helicase-like C-terminal domain-containing protein n=1 Tax=Caenorhabditis remanei TaxID=31234 RepID=E3NL41_CAERE|nr:hypothetical protein CRE_07882 [Caenorhabditis remanei]
MLEESSSLPEFFDIPESSCEELEGNSSMSQESRDEPESSSEDNSSPNGKKEIRPFIPRHNHEYENREFIEILEGAEKDVFDEALKLESLAHPFSEYYENIKSTGNDYNLAMNIRALFDNYPHYKALRFMAKSHVWFRRAPPTEILPSIGHSAVHQFVKMDGDHAIYRVILVKSDKYILMACHMNTHAFHRGDLRFVEVNNRTKTNASPYSCLGHLALGDLVAVSELAITEEMPTTLGNMDVYSATPETRCVWMVKMMTLLKRQTFENVPFSFLGNGSVVALKWGQVLNVQIPPMYGYPQNVIFLGNGFIPEKVPEFASGLDEEQHDLLLGLTRNISKYPWSTGTIFSYEYSPYFTSQFDLGHRAHAIPNPDPDGVVELCALMGATAVTAVLVGNFDCRSFRMLETAKVAQNLISFTIENTGYPQPYQLWKANARILISSSKTDAEATISTVFLVGGLLKFTAILSPEYYDFQFTDKIHMVSQKEMPEGEGLRDGFLEKIPDDSNGKRIIEALYGGYPIVDETTEDDDVTYYFPGTDRIVLNEFQNEYVSKLLKKTPLTLADSPFGSGKSMTIATAAYYAARESRLWGNSQQLLVTQSNFASVNLVDITKRYTKKCRVVRYVPLNTWMELSEGSRTDLDLPVMMRPLFMEYVTGRKFHSNSRYLFEMAKYLKEFKLIEVEQMEKRCQTYFRENTFTSKYDFDRLTRLFFTFYQPQIVITTSDCLRNVLPMLHEVSTVQFDESSQMPESALIQVLSMFPYACFGLVGDIRQLPPYCDYSVVGHLKMYGVGNTMERACRGDLFPRVVLRYVYRCHPVTTKILGSEFYGRNLLSAVKEEDRNEFMRSRPDLWQNPNFPIMVLNNNTPGIRDLTSMHNPVEVSIVSCLIDALTSSPLYSIHPSNIGVISFYKAQNDRLLQVLADKPVKCGTVDSFQGTEKEIIIVCCTNEVINGFMAMPNRINVAMSRAKQATFIIGNVSGLRMAIHWSTLVNEAERFGCMRY